MGYSGCQICRQPGLVSSHRPKAELVARQLLPGCRVPMLLRMHIPISVNQISHTRGAFSVIDWIT